MRHETRRKWIFGAAVLFSLICLSTCNNAFGPYNNSADPGSATYVPHYTVSYNGNGATSGSVPVDSTGYTKGSTVTVLGNTGNLVRSGSNFLSWNTQANGGGTVYTPGQTFSMGNSGITLYAQWALTYNVTYIGNGATGGNVPIDPNSYTQGQTVTVLGNTGNLVDGSFLFVSWNTQASGGGTAYTPGQTLSMGDSNITLYAQWIVPACCFTVTYNGNGATGGNVPIDPNSYTQGQTVTVLGNTGNLVNGSLVFKGWNTEANGGGTSYTSGQTFSIGTSSITLYAVWTILKVMR